MVPCAPAVFAREIGEELTIGREVALAWIQAATEPLPAGETIAACVPEGQMPPPRCTFPQHDTHRGRTCEQHELPAVFRKEGCKIGEPVQNYLLVGSGKQQLGYSATRHRHAHIVQPELKW